MNVFGAVPVVTTTDYTVSARIGRTPVDSVNARILTDLQAAQQVLPGTYPSSRANLRPNLYTVKALLAKIYLYQKNWQAAYNAADTIINSGLYALEPNLNNVFLDGSQEAIWQLPAYNGTTFGDVHDRSISLCPSDQRDGAQLSTDELPAECLRARRSTTARLDGSSHCQHGVGQ